MASARSSSPAWPLFVVLFIWMSGAFWTAIAGFAVRLAGRDPAALHPEDDPLRPLKGRTAIVSTHL